ncbi:MFS transporter [Candidatus Paracaedibacter symbiosus]|uniref:MFS transporter n=1 Tax=Candidatus Paracaedibacter symbiosus TaxID=244582 RepID=UPI00094E1E43|nr:MFS transporter [Candidatus Paracaedibacter symbiosus]
MWLNYWPVIWRSILLQTVLAIGMYTVTVYYVNYIREFLSASQTSAFICNMGATLMLGASAILSGWLSDLVGRKKMLLSASLMILTCGFISVYLSSLKHTYLLLLAQMVLSFSIGQFLGATPAALAEIFPIRIRYTAIAFTNNICMGIFGGTAPLTIFYWTHYTGDIYVPAYYLAGGAIVSFIFVMNTYKKMAREPLSEEG